MVVTPCLCWLPVPMLTTIARKVINKKCKKERQLESVRWLTIFLNVRRRDFALFG